MASRNPDDLVENARTQCKAWVNACAARGVTVLVYCTFRSAAEQDELFTHGRTAPGPVVTNARGWQSWHNVRRAWDAVPMVNGKPLWNFGADLEPWKVLIAEGDGLGLEWAGRWTTFKEFVHWQVTDGLTYDRAKQLVETLGLANE